MLKDNLVVILLGSLFSQAIGHIFHDHFFLMNLLINSAIIVSLAFGLTMIRFWRTPQRKINAMPNEIVSPADGKVIYVKLIEAGETPVSIKRDVCSSLEEVTKTNLLDNPCWLMGINMTPFDVHKNCTPIDGKIILNQHFNGKFLSLKDKSSLVENERNTYVIQGNSIKIGVVQIASRLVRRIDSYVTEGSTVSQGDWLGMIRFGSQVDVILPKECAINAEIGQQIYAGKTIIARI